MKTLVFLVPCLLAICTACKSTGLGDSVRKDVSDRMASGQPEFAACYQRALTRNRKLNGNILLGVTAAASTGKFSQVAVKRDGIGDPELVGCVVDKVKTLALVQPTKTTLTFDYPIQFQPEN
jgi:hypothetical protein